MKYGSKEYVLGVTVTNRAVHAALVQDAPDGPVVVRQFHRPRASMDLLSGSAMSDPFAEPLMSDDPDVQFGMGDSVESSFLNSEFGASKEQEEMVGDLAARPSTVEIELTDILDECVEAGFVDVNLVFCVNSTDLGSQELVVPGKGAPSAGPAAGVKHDRGPIWRRLLPGPKEQGLDRDRLIQALARTVDTPFDPAQVAFLPMTPNDEGRRRLLAVYTRPTEPIIPTLTSLIERKRALPAIELIGTEISLLLGMVRMTRLKAGEEASTNRQLLVRVATEDTLVLFLEGGNLRYFESMRSITAFDSPDTICSRILLLQDEYGMGEADEVFVLGEDQEVALIDRFETFFPDAPVRSLREHLPRFADVFDEEPSREAALAGAAALRVVGDAEQRRVFEPVDFFPKKLTKKRRSLRLQFNWPVIGVLIVLFSSTLFFTARYYSQQHEIEMYKLKLGEYSTDVAAGNARQLQARIDSIGAVSIGYLKGLDVLDSLLIGSDRWSRAMERTARETASVSGIWVETWDEVGGVLELTGNATDRRQVVDLADRMDGIIQSLSFSSIRDWPVYSFRMTVPIPSELPAAAIYLRERAAADGTPVRDASWTGAASEAAIQ